MESVWDAVVSTVVFYPQLWSPEILTNMQTKIWRKFMKPPTADGEQLKVMWSAALSVPGVGSPVSCSVWKHLITRTHTRTHTLGSAGGILNTLDWVCWWRWQQKWNKRHGVAIVQSCLSPLMWSPSCCDKLMFNMKRGKWWIFSFLHEATIKTATLQTDDTVHIYTWALFFFSPGKNEKNNNAKL